MERCVCRMAGFPHDLTWRRAPALQKLAERSDSTVSATPIHPPADDNALETSEKASRVGDFEGDANEANCRRSGDCAGAGAWNNAMVLIDFFLPIRRSGRT
jgi:hypothetical protein